MMHHSQTDERTKKITRRLDLHTLTACSIIGLALAGCTSPSANNSADETTSQLDPLTCYIDGDETVDVATVTLRCGGGVTTSVDLKSSAQEHVGDWVITKTSVGASNIGSSIVKIHATNEIQTCTYYRDMADPPEKTTKDCQ